MKRDKLKLKLKKLGDDHYLKYFFNSNEILKYVIDCISDGVDIDDNKCETIFNVSEYNVNNVYELCMYYPNKLRELKFINDDLIAELYFEFGETIEIMNSHKMGKTKTVRGQISNNAQKRCKDKGREYSIISEDIKLPKLCPLLGIPLKYDNFKADKYSASIDRIDSTKGYVKGNIQIISLLANRMKSNATEQELVRFSKNVLKLYGCA